MARQSRFVNFLLVVASVAVGTIMMELVTQVARALRRTTRTIPIVFAEIIDPISYGLVAGLARPGGNITGFMMFETTLAAKWLELLKQIKPDVTRVAVM
jgi:putative ABC transport system substrate-binding protein